MVFRFLSSVTGSTLFWFATALTAHATEQLRVPFACEATPSGVLAFPSADQNYPIIGNRDAAPFTACASDNPNRCRTMMLHRFDIDCDGTRVSWPEFYAAISEVTTGGRAQLEGERLLVRVRPQPRRNQRRSRFDPPPSRRSFVVEMPNGYAPIRGTVARFEGQRAARRQPMRATRDPFSTVQPNEDYDRQISRRIPAPPVRQAQQPERRQNVISVPPQPQVPKQKQAKPKPSTNAEGASRTAPAKKMAIKTVPGEPNAEQKVLTKNALEQEPKPPTEINRKPYKAIDVAESIKQKKIEQEKVQEQTPAVVPKLLNGSKGEFKQLAAPGQREATPRKAAAASTKPQPKSVEDLLRDRATELNNDLAQKTSPAAVAAQAKIEDAPKVAHGAVERDAAGPSLANTLAVLGVVASLLLALSFAAYRLLTPKQAQRRPNDKQGTLGRHASSNVNNVTNPPPSREPNLSAPPVSTKSQPKEKLENDNALKVSPPKTEPALSVPPDEIAAAARSRPALEVPVDRAPGALKTAKSFSEAGQPVIPSLSSSSSATEMAKPQSKAEPELPMPELIAAKLKEPDFNESALLLPKTRQEALTALGIGESANSDVIEKVVIGLRQCWRPDDADDKHERKRRRLRMQQIETAWQILSRAPKDNAPAKDISERAH